MVRAPGLRIGYVPQKLAVDRTLPLTVDGFLRLAGGGRPERVRALEHVGIPELGGRQLAALSGGQLQRAMLAQAMLRRPGLLVLDEATQGLDQAGEARFYRLIEQLRQELGCGVLMVSHDLHVVMAASDRVICLNGHVCCEGTPTIVSAAPAYRSLFGFGTQGALALYRHDHDHEHGHDHGHGRARPRAPSRSGRGGVMGLLDDFLVRAMLAGVGLAVAAGPLGCFVVWRRMAYFGDATAHAALLGVTLALATGLPVVLGVAATALAMALTVSAAAGRSHAVDTVLGVAAHGALALGMVALSFLERRAARPARLPLRRHPCGRAGRSRW